MGFVKNIINAKVSGNVGSMNFRRRGQQSVAAERSFTNRSKGKGATLAQRLRRSLVSNVVNFYKVIAAFESRAWERKPSMVSDYSMFCKMNLSGSAVYLTKEEAKQNASVIAPYVVSRGSLPSINYAFYEGDAVTGLSLGKRYDFDEISVAEFSQAIIANNEGWQNGDKLSIARLNYRYDGFESPTLPQVVASPCEITLDISNPLALSALPGVEDASLLTDSTGALYLMGRKEAFFMIHSRKVNGVLLTSSQSVATADDGYGFSVKYVSEEQKQAAAVSYGYQDEVLLSPDEI